MKQVGITGGIGSGKSTVCKIFETLNVPVFYADNEAKILMNSNEILKTEIANTFGKDVYKNNELDRKKLAQLVFNNPEALSKLNALVHPKVGVAYQSWLQKQNHPFVLKEAAILLESGSNKNLDEVIYVSAPESLRIKRVCLRDGVEVDQVQSRIKNQWPEEKKLKLSDHVVINDDIKMVIPQVLKLNQRLLQ